MGLTQARKNKIVLNNYRVKASAGIELNEHREGEMRDAHIGCIAREKTN
jgi:hypothetical protein